MKTERIRYGIRMPEHLVAAIKEKAEREERSFNYIVVKTLELVFLSTKDEEPEKEAGKPFFGI